MKDLRATFYDLRGYLIPGCVFLWGIVVFMNACGYCVDRTSLNLLSPTAQLIFFLIFAYTLGHLLHAISNQTIDHLPFASCPPKNYFDSTFDDIFSEETTDALVTAIARFTGTVPPPASLKKNFTKKEYWTCFQYVMFREVAEVETFLSLTGFYRGMTVGTALLALLFLGRGVVEKDASAVWIGVICLAASGFFLKRVERFCRYLTTTSYLNFLYLSKESPSTTK